MTNTQNGIAPETVADMTADELQQISRKLSTYAGIYTGDKEARQMSARCKEVAALLDAATAALQRQPAQFSQWNSAIFAAANAIKKAEPPKKPSPGNVLDRSDYYCTRADYVNAVLALAQSPLSQGGEAIWCQACGSTVPNHHYATCPTKAPGAEVVVTLREKMVKALDGHTKYSRDCDMSGEFLTSQVWPMVEAAIRPAMPAPAQTKWDAGQNRHYEPVERRAAEIYAAYEYVGVGGKPAWVPHGNSDKQDLARLTARQELRAAGHAPIVREPAPGAEAVADDIIQEVGEAIYDAASRITNYDRRILGRVAIETYLKRDTLRPAMPAPAQGGGVTVTKDKKPTAETVETVISLARQAAFLHSQLTDSPDYPTMLFVRLARLHDAMTVYDGEEPDLTFCCHCHELIEGGQFVMFGAKYHEVCGALQAALHPAEKG